MIKLAGEVSLNPETGQIVTTFKNTPDVPFENLELHFFGGERAPLSDPVALRDVHHDRGLHAMGRQWSVTAESSFKIEHGPHGARVPVRACRSTRL